MHYCCNLCASAFFPEGGCGTERGGSDVADGGGGGGRRDRLTGSSAQLYLIGSTRMFVTLSLFLSVNACAITLFDVVVVLLVVVLGDRARSKEKSCVTWTA